MNRLTLCVAMAAALGMGASMAHADSFTYHGTLQDSGQAANGTYDLQLTLYSAQAGGSVLAGPITVYGVTVKDGNFNTNVDFGPMSPLTSQGWVDVRVRPAGSGAFAALDNRSPVEPQGTVCPGAWTLDGNAAIPGGSYLGTADSTSVFVKSNAGTVAFFNPNGSTGISFPYGTTGAYSTAIGYNAGTNFDGSTVVGGRNDVFDTTVRDSATNQFIVAAEHGVGINTGTGADGGPLYDELTVAPSPSLPSGNTDLTLETPATASSYAGFNVQADPTGYMYIMGLYNTGAGLQYDPLMRFDYVVNSGAYISFNTTTEAGALTVGDASHIGGGAYLSTGGVWTNASSRTFKDGFGSVDVAGVLEKLVSLPMQTWFYRQSHDEGQHMGPFAEDFAQAFGLGVDDKHIATVDESGVAFAAIQGLNKKVETENASLKEENAELRGKLDAIAARLDRLEARKGE